MSYFDTSGASFNANLRMLETSDPCHADTFNALFGQLINNDVAIQKAAGGFASTKNAQAKFLLDMRRTGKKYGVHWDAFDINPYLIRIAKASAEFLNIHNVNFWAGVFEDYNEDKTQVQYIRGIDNEFSRTERDVWCLFLTQWIRIEITATGENLILSDMAHEGFFPEGGAIRPDGTIRPYVAIAKYQDSSESSGTPNSISGHIPSYNNSHNSMITKFHGKGSQYCGTTAQDWQRMTNLFDVAFATRDSQSIMCGTTGYSLQYPATVEEADVERIIIAKSQAANLLVGSCVSIGNATALNTAGTTGNIDRGQAGMHAKANRVLITKIEDYDDTNAAVYVDNGGTVFSTAKTVVNNVDCPTYLSTMPWYTGACDDVLGSCGSPSSNSSGKEPYILFGVELALGQYEVCSNVIMNVVNGVMRPHVCYDCTKLSSNAPTEDYEAVAYTLALTDNAWKYISVLGFDPDNPMVRHGTEVNATSTTGYADGQHTGVIDETTNAKREVLLGGTLYYGANAGRRSAYLGTALSSSDWSCAARLSASGRCAQSAA